MKNNFYLRPEKEVLASLGVNIHGLSDEDISSRRKEQGFNELVEVDKKGMIEVFFDQLKDFLVIILLVSAGISIFLGKWESAIVIAVVVAINALLGTIQHIKTEQSLKSLKALSSPRAKVIRNREKVEIPARELLVGDIMLLEAGDFVSADGRILESFHMQVNESSLTGEAENVQKISAALASENLPLGDQKNMLFSGSFVTYGRGVAVVTAIGMNSELGLIANLIETAQEKKTPLQGNLDDFAKKLAAVIIAIAGGIFFLNTIVRGNGVAESLMFAISLAVAAIPEALSAIVTIVLAVGTQKMSKEKAIIRKLPAVESLGSVAVICSDKTGTLTQNRMSVQNIYVDEKVCQADGLNYENVLEKKLLQMAILCNDAIAVNHKELGDPTELALIVWGQSYGLDELTVRMDFPRVGEVPFDSERKLMSTVHAFGDKVLLVTKGAPDVLLSRLSLIATSAGDLPATEQKLTDIRKVIGDFSANGLRVLAVGYKEIQKETVINAAAENGLTFLGLVSMMDPPRVESAAAVAACIKAGIKPVMITGDHKITAIAIARQVGILGENDEALAGSEIDLMQDEELAKHVDRLSVYARVSPEHKLRIVKAWQEKGQLVAMTGDGVNDAPALKQADIGIAMGITGTEVAKDSADMILADDNFSTIVKAIANGRAIYSNINKSIRFLLSGNAAGILSVLYASLLALPIPFAAVHLLFINLITDSLPAIALGLEPHRANVMEEKPRPANSSIINKRFAKEILGEGLLIAICTMTAFHIGLQSGDVKAASTMAFAVLCLARLLHSFNCRSKESVLSVGVFKNPYVWVAVLAGYALLEIVLRYAPLAGAFEVVPLTDYQYLILYAAACMPLLIIQGYKLFFIKNP